MKNTFVNSHGDEFSHEEITQQLMARVSSLEQALDETNTFVDTIFNRLLYLESLDGGHEKV